VAAEKRKAWAAAKDAEGARLLSERMEAEQRDRQRKQRVLLERDCLDRRENVIYAWHTEVHGIAARIGVVELEPFHRHVIITTDEPAARKDVRRAFDDGVLELDRTKLAADEQVTRTAVAEEETTGWEAWRKVRLEHHYRIWVNEESERVRMYENERAKTERNAEQFFRDLHQECDAAFKALVTEERVDCKDALDRERERKEELKRRMFAERQQVQRDEATAREETLETPAKLEWHKIAQAEARGVVKVKAEADERQRREYEERAAREKEDAERREAERRATEAAIQADFAKQRERQRQELIARQAIVRERRIEKNLAERAKSESEYDEWVNRTTASMSSSTRDAHEHAIARETATKLAVISTDESADRATIHEEAASALDDLRRVFVTQTDSELRQDFDRRLRAAWTKTIPAALIERSFDIQDEEEAGRKEIDYDWSKKFRSWIDAIAIEEQLLDAEGRRITTQRLLEVCTEEAEERTLLKLAEGLLRVELEAAFDRGVLLEWEMRCTDAMHAYAIDVIDAYIDYGPSGIKHVGILMLPYCNPRSTFEDLLEQRTNIPSLAFSSMALTPRPPINVLASIATTPGRLQHRVKQFELRGVAGTPTNMFSMMQRFDSECRSECSTPFANSGGVQTGIFGRGGLGRTHSFNSTLPAILPSARQTPRPPAIMDKPSPPLTASRLSQMQAQTPKPRRTAASTARSAAAFVSDQQTSLPVISTPSSPLGAASQHRTASSSRLAASV
jgi:hypothetical protein